MNSYPPEIDLIEMRRELDELRAKFARLENGHNSRTDPESDMLATTDRRGMMKKMAGLAVGVAAVGLLKPGTAHANKIVAPNATGDPVSLGSQNNMASTSITTGIINPGGVLASVIFASSNYATGSAFIAPANTHIGVGGFSNATSSTTPDHDVVGVYGIAVTAGDGTATGVVGVGTDVGVEGSGHIGVSGTGAGNGCGVDATVDSAATNAYGVRASASSGVGGAFEGGRAAIILFQGSGAVADPNVAIPTGGGTGDLYRGSANGGLWYNAGGTNPYRRVADNTTAGALTTFAASSRFVNLSPLAAGAVGTYQMGGVTVTGNTVPAKARAVIGRIADANPTGGGGNILISAINPPVGGGVIGVVAGAPQNSSFISALDATGKLYVRNTSPSGSVQIIIDIQGYYE